MLTETSRRRAVARSGFVVVAAIFCAHTARADVFRYVDREGRVHDVRVRELGGGAEAPTEPTPPPEDPGPGDGVFPYSGLVRAAAELYSIPSELVFAVMRVESGGNPRAVSRVGAMGLMQLMPTTAGDLGVIDPFDPRQNIFGGAHQLRILINGFDGDVKVALGAYHAGSAAIRRNRNTPPMAETRRYVENVLHLYRAYAGRDAVSLLPSATSMVVRGNRAD